MNRRTFGSRAALSSSYVLRISFGVIPPFASASIFTLTKLMPLRITGGRCGCGVAGGCAGGCPSTVPGTGWARTPAPRPTTSRPAARRRACARIADDNIPSMAEQTMEHAQPLTRLAEDEVLFRDSVREFADGQIRPLVREMDEQAKIPRALV